VTHFDFDVQLVCQLLQFVFPQSGARSIATAAVSGDENPFHRSLPISFTPEALPPSPYGRDRELRRVVGDANIYPRFIVSNVVDPVGNDLAFLFVREVVSVHLDRLSLSPPRSPRILVIPDDFLLFRIDRDGRLACPLLRLHAATNVFKLGIAVRVLLALYGLAVCLEAVACILE
jgi:hypothetical protein